MKLSDYMSVAGSRYGDPDEFTELVAPLAVSGVILVLLLILLAWFLCKRPKGCKMCVLPLHCCHQYKDQTQTQVGGKNGKLVKKIAM